MSKLFMLTVTGLDVKTDWREVRERILDEFADVLDVMATTLGGTILVVYREPAEVDRWLDTVTDTILDRRRRQIRGYPLARGTPALTQGSPSVARARSRDHGGGVARRWGDHGQARDGGAQP
jgi:hypothetical protein